MEDTFTCIVKLHERNQETAQPLLDEQGQPIVQREIGTFTFRVPTVHDNLQMAVKRRAFLAPITNPEAIANDPYIQLMSEALAAIPLMVKQSPEGWDWQHVYNDWTMLEIYAAYNEGLADLRKKNPTLL